MFLIIPQLTPLNPVGHSQMYGTFPVVCLHIPPFLHGLGVHEGRGISVVEVNSATSHYHIENKNCENI